MGNCLSSIDKPLILNAEPFGFSVTAKKILLGIGRYVEGSISSFIEEDRRQAEVLIVRLERRIDKPILAQFPALRWIVSATTGLDHIDLDATAARGVEVLSLRGEAEFLTAIPSTAEHTWALLLALCRKIPASHASVVCGEWNRDAFRGTQLQNKTLGIIGLGRTGLMVAGYGSAFGMNVHYFDPNVDDSNYKRCTTLESLLEDSDVVTLHVHLTPETTQLLNASMLARMRSGAVLINTSRGRLLDEDALAQCVKTRRIAGAAVDVLASELQQRPTSPLLQLASSDRNVIITPHLGGATWEAMHLTEVFMANMLARAIDSSKSI
jgi:D-3-phosphoglycerate dehydrogenase